MLACARALAAPSGPAPTLPLVLSGKGPVYTLDVDAQARQLSASATLGDLRVRNAAGETMAFAWAESPPASAPQLVTAHLYKAPGDAGPRQAWIVDTHGADDDLLRLDLALERDTQGVYTLRIEASDDLQHWRTLLEDAPLVQLQALPQVGAPGALATLAGRAHPSADGIDLDNVPARYLRLTTAPRSAIPPLVSASVTRAPHRPAPAPLEWSTAIAAAGCEETSCDYPLPPNTPVAAVQVLPAEVDTIGQVMVLGQVDASRQAASRPSLLRGSLQALRLKATRYAGKAGLVWESAAIASVYWLSQASGAPDLHSPPVRLDGETWQALRVETFGPISQLGRAAPAIRIGVRQRQLVFVARGAGPFVLARATPADRGAPMSLAELMPERRADAPLPAASAAIAPAVVASAAPTPDPSTAAASNAPWLWIALPAGLVLVGAVAWTLRRRLHAAMASKQA
ncbi:DUF3999 family protein [Scleromatobacter humisilvae]|uniref:DUF3999 domain-containing protein n=1 Tax=Scleromatobacter humisilvae TaxID=2897159 RepID=A0A9X2C1Z3_9BURK|nr:DUF3999 family protein [Scleromatobacter humisilvae]MCK9689373.1 DUF3999 domain-containing protein [Scleromatobacter humisilvae]